MESLDKFYVYTYSDDNGVFYVGRGNGPRMFDHMKMQKHYNVLFESRLVRLRECESLPIIKKVRDNLSTEEADDLEISLISKYGRIGYEEGGVLVNRTRGGEHGLAGLKHSDCTKRKMSDKAKLRTGSKNPRAKKWIVTDPKGTIYPTDDLVAFCKDHDIWYRGLTNCFRKSDGMLKSGKNIGWKLEMEKI